MRNISKDAQTTHVRAVHNPLKCRNCILKCRRQGRDNVHTSHKKEKTLYIGRMHDSLYGGLVHLDSFLLVKISRLN